MSSCDVIASHEADNMIISTGAFDKEVGPEAHEKTLSCDFLQSEFGAHTFEKAGGLSVLDGYADVAIMPKEYSTRCWAALPHPSPIELPHVGRKFATVA
jgi:hypothetical protein